MNIIKLFSKNRSKAQYNSIVGKLQLDEVKKEIIKSTWLDYFLLADKNAMGSWRVYNVSQIIIIVIGLLIPLVEKLCHKYLLGTNLTWVSILSLTVAIITSLNRQMNFEAKWRHYRRTAEAMRNEADDFFALSGVYEKFATHDEGYRYFITTITTFKRNEVSGYIESGNKDGK